MAPKRDLILVFGNFAFRFVYKFACDSWVSSGFPRGRAFRLIEV